MCVRGEQLTSTLFPHLEMWTGAVCRPDLEGKETHCAPRLSPHLWETGGAGVICGRATNSIRHLGTECHTDKLDAMYLPPPQPAPLAGRVLLQGRRGHWRQCVCPPAIC